MKNYLRQIILLLLIAGSSFAQDTILLNNGDVLTGRILEQSASHVYFKSSAFGSVSLDPQDIAEIRIQSEELGEITVPNEAIQPDTDSTKKNLPVSPTVALSQKPKEQPKEQDQWSGQAGLAMAMRESNTLRRSGNNLIEKQESFESYRLYGNVDWKSERNNLRWDWTYRYSRSDVRLNDDFLNLTQKYKHTFANKSYYASAKTVYQRDFRRSIENEYLQTAEMGVKWINKAKLKLSTSAGGGYHKYDREIHNSSTGETDQLTVSQPKFIFDESLRWELVNSLTFIQKYTHLGDLENYHFVFSAGLENKLVRDLFLRVEYRLDRDTEVSYDDKGYYDKALLTSLLYKF